MPIKTIFWGLIRTRLAKTAALILILTMAGAAVQATAGSHLMSAPKAADSSRKAKPKWYQVGIASWYGRQFQGHKTASGEAFDLHMLTCAHRTLPIGTCFVSPTSAIAVPSWCASMIAAPVPEERIVDLSYAAAQSLGFKNRGRVHVKLERIEGAEAAQLNWPSLGRSENLAYSR